MPPLNDITIYGAISKISADCNSTVQNVFLLRVFPCVDYLYAGAEGLISTPHNKYLAASKRGW